jgi:DNA-binding transcriptional LysR family regulator
MFDLELLRSFVSVVDAGGFTRAGERVHRTQSTVSQQIKRLEEDVGQPLLVRSGKDVTPKPANGCSPMRGGCWRWRKKRATS